MPFPYQALHLSFLSLHLLDFQSFFQHLHLAEPLSVYLSKIHEVLVCTILSTRSKTFESVMHIYEISKV